MKLTLRRLRLARPICAVDVETTGTDPGADRVVEVGAVRVEPGGRLCTLRQLVNPGRPIPPPATTVHGLTDADVAACPPFAAVAPGLLSFLDGADLAGFNLPFDLSFLTAEFGLAGLELDLAGRAVLDALAVFRRKEPRDLGAAVRLYLGRDHARGHRAVADARAALEVLDAQLARYPDLPAHPAALHRVMIDFDVAGRFRRDAARQPSFAFGKYAGRALAGVAASDPSYLRWLLAAVPLLADARELVRGALESRPRVMGADACSDPSVSD